MPQNPSLFGNSFPPKEPFYNFLTFVFFLGASFLSINTGHNVVVADFAILGNLGLIFLFFWIAKRKPSAFSIRSLLIKRKGLIFVSIYLILLYVLSFLFLVPQKIPESPLPILTIISFYAFIAFLIKKSPTDEVASIDTKMKEETLSTKTLLAFCLLQLILTSIFCVLPQIGLPIAFTLNMVLFIGGPLFFIFIVAKTFRTDK